ncbi:MAG: phosphate-starvation-inducible PsiE family protein [Pseudanabaenaceae cyanobacterium]
MRRLRKLLHWLTDDTLFLQLTIAIERLVAKVLAIAMVVVILVGVWDLGQYLLSNITKFEPVGFFTTSLIRIFGLFLNVLVAIEILQNITSYLRKHAIQLELVIVTALTAVARKIIIYDSKETGADIGALALASLALAISYWIIRSLRGEAHE